MAGLEPAIQRSQAPAPLALDGRVKPAHGEDEGFGSSKFSSAPFQTPSRRYRHEEPVPRQKTPPSSIGFRPLITQGGRKPGEQRNTQAPDPRGLDRGERFARLYFQRIE